MTLSVQVEREEDGRWIAEVVELPGALAYAGSADEAIVKAKALALHAVSDDWSMERSIPIWSRSLSFKDER